MRNKEKTLICVAIAGLLFLPAVIFDMRLLVIVGAFFDWLPLPTGWMKIKGGARKNRKIIIAHAAVTLIAYAFAVLWLINPAVALKFLLIETWWTAVMLGAFISW